MSGRNIEYLSEEAIRAECEAMLDNVPFALAAEDPDVQAWVDLQRYGETDAVKEERAKWLEEIMEADPEIFYREIQQQFGINQSGFEAAIDLCRARTIEEKG